MQRSDEIILILERVQSHFLKGEYEQSLETLIEASIDYMEAFFIRLSLNGQTVIQSSEENLSTKQKEIIEKALETNIEFSSFSFQKSEGQCLKGHYQLIVYLDSLTSKNYPEVLSQWIPLILDKASFEAEEKEHIAGNSLRPLLDKAKKIAQTDSTVLITGESGTGKEVLAGYIQSKSLRRESPFTALNCAALPEELLEVELFGHTKGSFTDAVEDKKGKLELCHNGTLFLDEIGELPMSIQAKLLRVLENGIFQKVGSSIDIGVDIRLITATNKNIPQLVKEGIFRKDLYYRLNVFHFHIPPLREREDDIIPLARVFLSEQSSGKSLSTEAITKLLEYPWPGNIRELKNVIQRAIVLSNDTVLLANDFNLGYKHTDTTDQSDYSYRSLLKRFKERIIRAALDNHQGNQTKAAKALGLQRTYLSRLIHELHIRK